MQARKLRLLKKLKKPDGVKLLLRSLEVDLDTVKKTIATPENAKFVSQSMIF